MTARALTPAVPDAGGVHRPERRLTPAEALRRSAEEAREDRDADRYESMIEAREHDGAGFDDDRFYHWPGPA